MTKSPEPNYVKVVFSTSIIVPNHLEAIEWAKREIAEELEGLIFHNDNWPDFKVVHDMDAINASFDDISGFFDIFDMVEIPDCPRCGGHVECTDVENRYFTGECTECNHLFSFNMDGEVMDNVPQPGKLVQTDPFPFDLYQYQCTNCGRMTTFLPPRRGEPYLVVDVCKYCKATHDVDTKEGKVKRIR